ncbi:hypothetical protein [Achromobacter insolitus]|uniref:hypothetical protein n=1 Tax=Achromobacter insolitus TaxID=217204 RepID=UPI0020A617EC|nr:hypothetical protein [Achromobacter insolitus]MCP1404459.1 hypothetical protein [Achromobacter insolitus]
MSRIPHGGPGEIAPVDEKTTGDRFENAIRAIGVVAACEWFGHSPDSEFTADTIRELRVRSGIPQESA